MSRLPPEFRSRPQISGSLVDTKELNWDRRRLAAGAPTLIVSFMPTKKFLPERGRVLQGFDFPKSEQYGRLTAKGVAVPDWILIEVGVSLDPKDWGSYVVIKPDLSRKGAEVKIKRTGRVRYTPPRHMESSIPPTMHRCWPSALYIRDAGPVTIGW